MGSSGYGKILLLCIGRGRQQSMRKTKAKKKNTTITEEKAGAMNSGNSSISRNIRLIVHGASLVYDRVLL